MTYAGRAFPDRGSAILRHASRLHLPRTWSAAPLTNRLKGAPIPVLLSLVLAGCTVSPGFHELLPPKDATYILASPTRSNPRFEKAPSDDQHFELGRDLPGQWWELFRSPELTELVTKALKQNPDLKTAQAALNHAQELLYASETNLLPSLVGEVQAQREQISGASLGLPSIRPTFSVVNGALSTSYTPDIWGGIHQQVEDLGAKVDYQRFELEATYLSLTSKVVTTAINIAAIRGQLSITKKIIRTEASELAIVHHQFLIGGASQADVLQQRTSLAIARTKLPPLIKQLSQLRNQLNALTGGYPNNRISSKFSLNTLHLPSRLPISLPSTLIAQRPDIRATQALLHAACARFGIAVANQLPQFTISASFGGTADSFTNIFSAATGVWSIMGGISQTLFHAGALLDKKRAAADALRQANEQYRSTVINAFENASNALRAVQIDASTFQVQEIAERNADQSYSLAKERYLVGATNYLTLLTTDRTWQKTKLSLVKDQAVRLSDTVALFQALGGGWWNRQDAGPPPKPAAALTIPIASAFQR